MFRIIVAVVWLISAALMYSPGWAPQTQGGATVAFLLFVGIPLVGVFVVIPAKFLYILVHGYRHRR